MLKSKHFWCTVMICCIVAFDQITKRLAQVYLCGKGVVTFISGVAEFIYTQNTGIAFSMFSGGRIFFIILTVIVVAACAVYMLKTASKKSLWLYWSLGVIMAGAIGNLIDRIFVGYVIDFINLAFINFAVFNIADCAITLGTASLVIYLVLDMFKEGKKENE